MLEVDFNIQGNSWAINELATNEVLITRATRIALEALNLGKSFIDPKPFNRQVNYILGGSTLAFVACLGILFSSSRKFSNVTGPICVFVGCFSMIMFLVGIILKGASYGGGKRLKSLLKTYKEIDLLLKDRKINLPNLGSLEDLCHKLNSKDSLSDEMLKSLGKLYLAAKRAGVPV